MNWLAVGLCGIGAVLAITSWMGRNNLPWWGYVLKATVTIIALAGLGASVYLALMIGG